MTDMFRSGHNQGIIPVIVAVGIAAFSLVGILLLKNNGYLSQSSAAPIVVSKQIELSAISDSYVSPTSPTQNYGTQKTLVSGGSSKGVSYLKFNTESLVGKDITGANISVDVSDVSAGEQVLSFVQDSNWSEAAINWNNKPGLAVKILTFSAKEKGSIKINLSALIGKARITQNLVSVSIGSTSTDTLIFSSREGLVAPKLVVDYNEVVNATATPTIAPTVSPTIKPSTSPTIRPSGTPSGSPSTPSGGGSGSSGGLGIGKGDGLEIGINLSAFNKLKTDAVSGVYNRPCTDAEHDSTKWHTLVNVSAKCHYDHEHGDDPNYVNDVFGVAGAWFGKSGQEVSYPWETFALPADMTASDALKQFGTPGNKENNVKHYGYYWIVRRDQNCSGAQWCITDSRLEIHFMTSHPGEVPVKWHSFSFEGRLCKNPADKSTCGIYRTGGWGDHGQLFVANNPTDQCWNARNSNPPLGTVVSLPSDNQFYSSANQGLVDKFRCHKLITNAIVSQLPNGYGSPASEWWVHAGYDFRYVIFVYDPISNVDAANPGSHTTVNAPYCSATDPKCRWNNSVMTAGQGYTTQIWDNFEGVPVDPDHNGITDFTLGKVYLNRFGHVNRACTQVGLDCIPLEISNVILNATPVAGQARYSNEQCKNCTRLDHDLTPAGVPSWITWFYTHYH